MTNPNKAIKRIAMLSTHGYFDPVPQLGQTDTGGQVVYVLELSKALASIGYQVDIYTRWFDKSRKQVDPVPNNPNVRVIRIPAGPWEFIPKEYIYDVLPELSDNMIEFIRNNELDYDLFHGHYVDAGIVTLDVAKAFNKPAFFTAHSLGAWKKDQMGGDPEEMEEKFNFKKRIDEEMRIFRSVNAHTLTSQVQKEKLNELYGYDAENIEIIPPGVNIHTYHVPTEEEKKKPTDLPDKYIFCLSRIDTNKGHDLLLHAFDLVRKEIGDIHLVIGGGSPNPKPREKSVFEKMKQIIRDKDMDRVHIIGYVPDEKLVQYYQQAEMFVLPSLFEPFGMTSQEAMACGKPVVASKFGGIRNTITHEKNGMLINPEDPNEFAEGMLKILRDESYRDQLGNAANKLIVDHYSWEAMADKHIELYKQYYNHR
ncbi:MAG: glycosyltransferase [Bacteroidales bacterium]|nr:glycosyltransferase [Bacteroidales bacterium]